MVAEFKKGKLYRVVKDKIPGCLGCILMYIGLTEDEKHKGKVLKAGNHCKPPGKPYCLAFQYMVYWPNEYKLIRHIDMVKFCKKLRKEIRSK